MHDRDGLVASGGPWFFLERLHDAAPPCSRSSNWITGAESVNHFLVSKATICRWRRSARCTRSWAQKLSRKPAPPPSEPPSCENTPVKFP
jgi:hypothetical protein